MECLAVAGARGDEGQQLLVGAAGEGAFPFPAFVYHSGGDAVEAGQQAQHACAQHIVEIDHRIEAVFAPQAAEESQQAAGSLVFIKIDSYHGEVLRRIDEYRCHGLAGDHCETHAGIAGADAVKHRHCHGNVAEG